MINGAWIFSNGLSGIVVSKYYQGWFYDFNIYIYIYICIYMYVYVLLLSQFHVTFPIVLVLFRAIDHFYALNVLSKSFYNVHT